MRRDSLVFLFAGFALLTTSTSGATYSQVVKWDLTSFACSWRLQWQKKVVGSFGSFRFYCYIHKKQELCVYLLHEQFPTPHYFYSFPVPGLQHLIH